MGKEDLEGLTNQWLDKMENPLKMVLEELILQILVAIILVNFLL